MGRVIDVNNDRKGLVRSVKLKIGERAVNENSKHKLERPIDKIVLLFESDNDNEPFQDNCYLEGSHVKLTKMGCTWV